MVILGNIQRCDGKVQNLLTKLLYQKIKEIEIREASQSMNFFATVTNSVLSENGFN